MPSQTGEPIAIIGSACHFAGGVSSSSKLWELLKDPQDVRREIPDSRFSVHGFYHRSRAQPGHSHIKHAYLLDEDLSVFDAEFFGIKPVEAKGVDPQQRWLMETVYEGLESAGLTIQELRGSDTSVYVGVMCSDYETMLLRDLQDTPTYFATGASRSILSNRISYFFDWRGPSITIDTACSSSLVAVHMAVQALRTGDSQVAVACGSNLIIGPENFIVESKLNMLSPDGICKMWDRNANGYARGDGVAAVVLKTLRAAMADGDHIESIIRETGLSQDGATPSITIPSASAQQALIRNTYARAGLDPLKKPEDRPQYFEAHGTGTPAGDPVEAKAIHHAFFGDKDIINGQRPRTPSGSVFSPLFVGSIKTILGHTEGTAGLAGILKASLALQHGVIPPNLQFCRLSDRVAPFYDGLEIVQGTAKPWPVVHGASHQYRRASVNSFGFGGANAHAILESYNDTDATISGHGDPLFTPFLFSASSEYSLRANLAACLGFLERNPQLKSHDLAWTLRQRRTLFAHRTYFAAASIEELRQQLTTTLQDEKSIIGLQHNNNGIKRNGVQDNVLGIFTGQGAQFARLGAELVEQSLTARNIILALEAHLNKLSTGDRPSWSLTTELLASRAFSRVNEATIAQPLCTAVQILLVDLLALSDVHFDAVIGHSSGEIGAAYAAGYLSARDAILIAYFRGIHVGQSKSPNGQHIRGAMVAVGTSMEDAEELCDDELFKGRLVLAACNSSSSVTISGDEDAIEELQNLLEDENKFYRRLRVGTAYHSRHMDPCFAPYVESLRRYGVRSLEPSQQQRPRACQWFSSVYNQAINLNGKTGLNDTYWAENMKRPVLFSQAIYAALLSTNGAGFGVALEIGPHPALQGPAGQTIQQVLGKEMPYHSTLVRGINAVTALSTCLGFIWQQLQREQSHNAVPKLDCYERAMIADDSEGKHQQQRSFKLIKGLPSYQWNHTNRHWYESRTSRRMRLRPDSYHPLLGHATPDSSPHHLRWRNLLRAETAGEQENVYGEDVLGLGGHRVEGQTVFPGAGYIVTAIEAAEALLLAADALAGHSSSKKWKKKRIHLIELHDLVIHQAVVLASDKSDGGVEVLIELTDINPIPKSNRIRARFVYSAALGRDDDALTLVASAYLEVLVGKDDLALDLLPVRPSTEPHMVDVEKDRFYTSLASLGYNYEGPFRSMSILKRKHGKASCLVSMEARKKPEGSSQGKGVGSDSSLLVQPAELDVAFQSLLLAYSYPGDGQLHTLQLPQRVGCIRVNPALCGSAAEKMRYFQGIEERHEDEEKVIHVDAVVLRSNQEGQTTSLSLSSPQGGFAGDINIFTEVSPYAAIQVQNVQLIPLKGLVEKEQDRNVFMKTHWVGMSPDGLAAVVPDDSAVVSPKGHAILGALERIAVFYFRQFDAQVPDDSPLRSPSEGGATAYYLQYARHVLSTIAKDWPYDTRADIQEAAHVCADLPDVGVMHLVGETMPRVFRGEATMLEKFRETRVLDKYYAHGFSPAPSGRWQSRVVEQIASRHPHLNMLEIGAGTGGTTKTILNALGHHFQSYTFTDVSPGFFGDAAATLSPFRGRLVFKALDIECDPRVQGFQEGTYDVIIASFVLHATASLSRTLTNVRKLLRPGGFLVVGEGSINTLASSFIFGPLDGWWLGRDDGREILSPHVSAAQWDQLLRRNGFSGIDTKAPDEWEDVLGVCLFASQAIDDQLQLLRSPLSYPNQQHSSGVEKLVIVGGKTDHVARLVKEVLELLKPFFQETHVVSSLNDVDYDCLIANDTSQFAVLSLADVDEPIFKDMTETNFIAFQRMFLAVKTILWVTTGRRSKEPFSNMVVGFGRVAVHEIDRFNLQHLDVADPYKEGSACMIAETFLRLVRKAKRVEEAEDSNMLWTFEPEVVVDFDGRYRVPRLQPLCGSNDRYNSGRRSITQEVDISEVAVVIQRDYNGAVALERLSQSGYKAGADPIKYTGSLLELQITYATLLALRTPLGHKFLTLGVDTCSGTRHLALVPSLASLINVPVTYTIPFPSEPTSEASILSIMAAYLIAYTVVEPPFPGFKIVVHNATDTLAEAIQAHATTKGVPVVFIADSDIPMAPKFNAIPLPPYLSQDELWKRLPAKKEISCFVSLTSRETWSESRDHALASLPAWCRRETVDTLYSSSGCDSSHVTNDVSELLLHQAFHYAQEYGRNSQMRPRVVGLDRLISNGKRKVANDANDTNGDDMGDVDRDSDCDDKNGNGEMVVVDLKTAARLPAHIKRLDAGRPMFNPDKTYWIVGLSGVLGISLCDWMFRAGARNLVLSSRNPQIEPAWVDSHHHSREHVTVIPCDITDYPALVAVHTRICATHPPIAGVLNGAMVLRDTSIHNMTFTQLNDVVRPKVLGSLRLDRLFSSDQPPLDYFLLLSSINCIIGNQGQANYAAANTFQCALAASRRQRGLAGVALNVGAIIGAGYIQRSASKRVLDLTVQRGAMMHLSEEDFHQLVAEAIAVGQPGCGDGGNEELSEISTGLLEVAHNASEQPVWFSDPKFTHLIVQRSGSANAPTGGMDNNVKANTPAAIQKQLRACRSPQDLEKVVIEAFAAQLCHELQVTTMEDNKLMEMRSNEMGLDSLVSVDIRSWFLKTLSVSIPVLRIMSNDTMATLVRHAVEMLPPALVPEMRGAMTDDQRCIVGQSNIQSSIAATSPTKDSCNDPAKTASVVVGQDEINWDVETQPPVFDIVLADQLQSHPGFEPTPASPPKTIVLTGVTGLLGRHLLSHLLQTTPATTKIICIAVRQLTKPGNQGLLNLPFSAAIDNETPNPRTTFHAGELSLPLLGLNPSTCHFIFATADTVLHLAADTSHLKPYAALRAANLGSTRELARLCLPRKVPLHYVSSAGVGLFSSRTTIGGVSEEHDELWPARAPGIPPTVAATSGGYMASKWASERLLERTNITYNLPVWIHRPSTIIRQGPDAREERARFDWLNSFVRYVRDLNAVPEVRFVKGALDMVFTRSVCEGIGRELIAGVVGCGDGRKDSAKKGEGTGEGRVTYVHEVGDVVVPLERMQDLLEPGLLGSSRKSSSSHSSAIQQQLNREPLPKKHVMRKNDHARVDIDYEVLPMQEWTTRAIARGLHPAVAALIEGLDGPGKPNLPRLRRM